jgi:hypothetical protein
MVFARCSCPCIPVSGHRNHGFQGLQSLTEQITLLYQGNLLLHSDPYRKNWRTSSKARHEREADATVILLDDVVEVLDLPQCTGVGNGSFRWQFEISEAQGPKGRSIKRRVSPIGPERPLRRILNATEPPGLPPSNQRFAAR